VTSNQRWAITEPAGGDPGMAVATLPPFKKIWRSIGLHLHYARIEK